ncbi:MAG: hypothetical protein L3K26_05650, partial [Candidatus Hydrogenedentes bacterium]|nr:hypothetical protein [Candidatus Hydrogenedentota bacterium]
MFSQRNVNVLAILALLAAPWTPTSVAQEAPIAVFDLSTARLGIDAKGFTTLDVDGDQRPWPVATNPIVRLDTEDGVLLPESVAALDDQLVLQFAGDRVCALRVVPGAGFAVFEVTRLDAPDATRLRLLSLPVPEGAEIMSKLNAARTPTHIAALSAAEINVHAYTAAAGRRDGDRAGCTHVFSPTDDAKSGKTAALFSGTSDGTPGGWNIVGKSFPEPLNLSGCKAIRAWVHGDGKGQQLKIQLYDGQGGYRDTYIPISFEGWQQVTVETAALDTLRYDRVTTLNIYYNSLPPDETVSCMIDQIEAIVERNGQEEAIVLENFERPGSLFWSESTKTLNLETLSRHGLLPARFGLIVSPAERFLETMARFEVAAGLPSPRPGGVWNKRSPAIQRSYLFITRFDASQTDDVIALAHRGGFGNILIVQSSWTRGTGHFEVNPNNFPGGLDTLVNTVRRFKEAGFGVGLHLLGASIYPPDTYLTPVPDPRLVKDAAIELAAGIDEHADFIQTLSAPDAFPAEDGGYRGVGTVIQIDDELIHYATWVLEAPAGFNGCKRGYLGTTPAAHAKGAMAQHLTRAYGYHMYDMDTSLIDEVAAHFARVANACDIDMIYFDGSERLQGEHWYYNAKLHKTFYDQLARKDILIQASSFSHYSWHILARSASADGHGDLKGYLDERSRWLDSFSRNAMPLDIGWYYGYDPNSTSDMYEYILGATIGYGSSMSFQVSLDAARKHPFTADILDNIARYERLRLSGRVPDDMRARLRIDSALAGVKTPEERVKLLDLRREYRLLGEEGKETFQRVAFDPWHVVDPADPTTATWTVRVPEGPARVGVQIHALPGPWSKPGPSYFDPAAEVLESFDDLGAYLPGNATGVQAISHGEAGSTLEGVRQQLALSEDGPKEGSHYAVYSAQSALGTDIGWSYIGKTFNPPRDLSGHKAIGFWMRGDGKGGKFKLQLMDGPNAADFYIENDYTGWRYQQIIRPKTDAIDYTQVRRLNFYYNGLPANTSVSCAIDDIRALREADLRTLTDPWLAIDGQKIACPGKLLDGQYVFNWPGEPLRRYGLPLTKPEIVDGISRTLVLSQGEYTVQFGSASPLRAPIRARVNFQAPEQYAVPNSR